MFIKNGKPVGSPMFKKMAVVYNADEKERRLECNIHMRGFHK
jgi:hypothetical protein